MAIDKGDAVEDFELLDQDGVPRRLSTLLADGPVVLFFYPAAMSTGCTAEACNFRDLAAEFRAAGAQRVGISRDLPAKQKQFAERDKLDYPLLSDPDLKVAEAMGVKRKRALPGFGTRRLTYVIGTDMRVIEVIHSELSMDRHAASALEALAAQKNS